MWQSDLGRIVLLVGLNVLTLVIFAIWPHLDLAVAGYFYGAEGFLIKPEGWIESLRNLIWDAELLVPVAALLMLPLTFFLRRQILLSTRQWGFALTLFLLGPGVLVNAVLKSHWGRARPSQVVDFGGAAQFTPAYQITDQCAHNCSFVSGEGAGVMALVITLLLVLAVQRPRIGNWGVRVGQGICLALLAFVGFHRVAAGGHFLSDVLMSWLLVALLAALLAPVLLKPASKGPRP